MYTLLNATYVYNYNNAGNITSKKTYVLTAANATPSTLSSTKSYTYGNTNWKDLLTAYNGVSLTYDTIGNPLSYYNGTSYTFGWNGRRLVSATTGSNSLSFTYNDSGIRTSKTKNGVTTTYYLSGSQIIAEETNGNFTVYIYDADGSILGFQYRGADYFQNTWDTYFFEKNLQGDVVAIYDEDCNKLVSYTYDAWGNFTRTYTNGGENTVAAKNPFTYRGYYFDFDLWFYYLNSRYYDPYIGRFINADGYISTGLDLTACNMFAYCENNPVNNCDPSGRLAITIIGVVAAVVAALATANDVYQIARSLDNDNTDEDKVLVTTPSDDNVHIENSYKILTPWMQYGYSFYLNHFNEDTKDIIQGSTKGVQYEWSLHNAAALLGFGESAENADIGKTIFADGDNRRLREDDGSLSEIGLMSLAMRLSYFVVSSPISWIGDLTVNGGF